jgi:polyisoprenoid-binding protein YceI
MNLKNKFAGGLFLVSVVAAAAAAPMDFDFKDPKGINMAVFKLDAPLEAITGTATGISGIVTFDPENPAAIKGKIVVAAASMRVGNPMQQQHLLGNQWMDAVKYPEINFETVSVKNVKTDGNVTTADVTGKMTIKDATKTMTVPVKMTYLKDKLRARMPGRDGDLLVLRADFKVKRSDFGINPGQMEDKVSDEIELSLSIAGAAPR